MVPASSSSPPACACVLCLSRSWSHRFAGATHTVPAGTRCIWQFHEPQLIDLPRLPLQAAIVFVHVSVRVCNGAAVTHAALSRRHAAAAAPAGQASRVRHAAVAPLCRRQLRVVSKWGPGRAERQARPRPHPARRCLRLPQASARQTRAAPPVGLAAPAHLPS
jgi:hypothetical protein